MQKKSPRLGGVGAAGSSRVLTADCKARYAPRFASPSAQNGNERRTYGQWAGRPIFTTGATPVPNRSTCFLSGVGLLIICLPSEQGNRVCALQRGAAACSRGGVSHRGGRACADAVARARARDGDRRGPRAAVPVARVDGRDLRSRRALRRAA